MERFVAELDDDLDDGTWIVWDRDLSALVAYGLSEQEARQRASTRNSKSAR